MEVTNPRRDRAQAHLENVHGSQTKFGYYGPEVYYGGPILEAIHAHTEPRGYPDVYVGMERGADRPVDYTITIDPLKNAAWQLPGHEDRHSWSVHRGALKDHAGVMRVVDAVDRMAKEGEKEQRQTYMFTSKELDAAPKYTPYCPESSSRGWSKKRRDGRLPTISQLIWQNRLPDKPDWQVEREVYVANTHLSRNRAFDCEGWCR